VARHPEFFDPDPTALNDDKGMKPVMSQYVDRRLRIVERMHYNDDAFPGAPPDPETEPDPDHPDPDGSQTWAFNTAGAKWSDGLRTIIFEYPFVSYTQELGDLLQKDGAWIVAGTTPKDSIYFKQDRYVRPEAADAVDVSSFTMGFHPPADSAAAKIDALVPTKVPLDSSLVDYWERNWTYCDQMLAILHEEALRFGLNRRTGNDQLYNKVVAAANVSFGAMGTGLIDSFFEYDSNVDVTDFETGDHFQFWNSKLYLVATNQYPKPAYQLENSLVAYAESDTNNWRFLGHGMPFGSVLFFRQRMGNEIERWVKDLQAKEPTFTRTGTHADGPNGEPFGYQIIFWDPIGDFDALSIGTAFPCWWVRIPLTFVQTLLNMGSATLADAQAAIPKSIRSDDPRATNRPPKWDYDPGDQPPDAVYFPLWEPNMDGAWEGYLDGKRPLAKDFSLTQIDPSMIPGFTQFGQGATLSVRPAVGKKVLP
jgi:hypothetical protein